MADDGTAPATTREALSEGGGMVAPASLPRLMRIDEAADCLQVGEGHVRKLGARGEILLVSIGAGKRTILRVDPRSIEAFIRRRVRPPRAGR